MQPPIVPTVPKDPRTERSLAAVLESAFALLLAQGPDGVTHAHVAHAANVSRTTIYKHYPTRADLLRATIDCFMHSPAAELTGDLRSDLRAMVGELVTDLADDDRSRLMVTMMQRAMQDPTVASVRDGFILEAGEMLASIIEAAALAGTLRSGIDIDLAMADLLGPFVFVRFMKGGPLRADLVDHVIDTFVESNRPAQCAPRDKP